MATDFTFETEVSPQITGGGLTFSDTESTQFHMDNDLDELFDLSESSTSRIARVQQEASVEQMTILERDPIYFCQIVYLVAEDRLFCIPKGGLVAQGSYFQSLFATSAKERHDPTLAVARGDSEKHPIVLEGVSKCDVQNFLRLIYPFCGVDLPSGDESWLGVLDLATKWGFQKARETAITHLEHIFTLTSPQYDPIRALYICQKYNIQKYIKQQFESLITSDQSLNRTAMQTCGIDMETILLLMDLRDRWMTEVINKKPKGADKRKLFAQKVIEDHFASIDAQSSNSEDNANSVVPASGEQGDNPDNMGGSASSIQSDNNNGASKADDATFDADEDDDDPLPCTHDRIKHLVRLYIAKQRIIDLIDEINEWKGSIEAKNFKLWVLKKDLKERDRQITAYWGRATGLSPSLPLQAVDEYRLVELVSLEDLESTAKMENALLKLMHPEAKSLSIAFHLGGTSKSEYIVSSRSSLLNEIRNRYQLHNFERFGSQRNGARTFDIPEKTFYSWLASI